MNLEASFASFLNLIPIMHLKSLEIHGFKSFADKTVFEFHQGVTGIVGPNGCGKSNVVDAIRWVLGETSAKALRGGEMADVIFNGTDRRKPHGMAEVTLTLSDCEAALGVDYNELAITRRVYRDGKSEYRINGTLCRLRDIHETFMDTGIGRSAYSIMEQGKIDMLLSSRPEDRRQVFEEAAGITKFKKEKKEALRKLEFTQANLLRVSDVMAEQERRMNSLKRQVSKARRYQTLATDVKILETHFAHRQFVELSAQRSELRTSLRALGSRKEELELELPEKEAAVVNARDQAQALEAALSELRQRASAHENAANGAQSRIDFNQERSREFESRFAQNKIEIAESHEKLEQQENDFEISRIQIGELVARIATQQGVVETQQAKFASAQKEKQGVSDRLRQARSQAGVTQSFVASTQARIESALTQLEGGKERLKDLEESEMRFKEEYAVAISEKEKVESMVSAHQASFESLEKQFKEAEEAHRNARSGLDTARQVAKEAHQLFTNRQSRLEVLEQLIASGEGFEKGTQAVLSGLDQPDFFKSSLRGVLASHLTVKDEYSRAIEAALGSHVQAVLVKDVEMAEAIIDKLVELKKGEVALLPETFAKGGSRTKKGALPKGAVSWALDCIEADTSVLPVLESLLGNVLVVPDRQTAYQIRKESSEYSLVTVEGELLSVEGVLRGGQSGKKKSSVLERQNEVVSLAKEVKLLQEKEVAASRSVLDTESKLSALREEVEASREVLQAHKVEKSNLEGKFSLASREVESISSKQASLSKEQENLQGKLKHSLKSQTDLESELVSAKERLEGFEEDQRSLQSQLEGFDRQVEEERLRLNEIQTSLAVEAQARASAEKAHSPMASRIAELRALNEKREKENNSFEARIQEMKKENEALQINVKENEESAAQLTKELEQSAVRRSDLKQAIELAEEALSKARADVSRVTAQSGKEEVSATKLDLRVENLVSSMLERHQVDLDTFRANTHSLLTCIAERKSARSSGSHDVKISTEERDSSEASSEDEEIVVEDMSEQSSSNIQLEEGPDWRFVEDTVGELRRKLDSMGPVNLDAIQEFDELEERFTFVKNQHDDLVSSKDELLEVIEKINTETVKLFSETFAVVKKNFRTMFKELFGEKGKADLILMDENDPLESGIEVIAKPPGKKLQSITLLSGGERSMTAVALLFSIYMVKPSPFCVLDELDAPLDESNIGRFLKVLDRFIDQSQFIIVTHNKRTMGRADVMYGVTMEEYGISKPVGMRLTSLAEAEAKKDEAKTAAQKAALKLDS